jgi:hypothetical protein
MFQMQFLYLLLFCKIYKEEHLFYITLLYLEQQYYYLF